MSLTANCAHCKSPLNDSAVPLIIPLLCSPATYGSTPVASSLWWCCCRTCSRCAEGKAVIDVCCSGCRIRTHTALFQLASPPIKQAPKLKCYFTWL